jgi:hypothetical protein
MPGVLAIKTLSLVNAEHLTAFRAGPLFFFGYYEMPYAVFPNVLKIGDHAHAVLGFITLIQMGEPVAGKAVTSKAVVGFGFRYLLAVLDFAFYTRFGFDAVIAPATWAWFPLSCECEAKKAVHSAGSYQLRGNCRRLIRGSIPHRRFSMNTSPTLGDKSSSRNSRYPSLW